MTELKTDKKELEEIRPEFEDDGFLTEEGNWVDLTCVLDDALHAHTLEARIGKVLAIEERRNIRSYENPDYARGWNKALKEIKAILGGE